MRGPGIIDQPGRKKSAYEGEDRRMSGGLTGGARKYEGYGKGANVYRELETDTIK